MIWTQPKRVGPIQNSIIVLSFLLKLALMSYQIKAVVKVKCYILLRLFIMFCLSHKCLKIVGTTNSTGPSYVWKWILTSALWKWPQKWKISSTSPLWILRTEPVAWLVFVSTSCMIKCGTMVEGSLLANRLTSLLGKGPSIKDVSSKGRKFNTVAAHLRAALS